MYLVGSALPAFGSCERRPGQAVTPNGIITKTSRAAISDGGCPFLSVRAFGNLQQKKDYNSVANDATGRDRPKNGHTP